MSKLLLSLISMSFVLGAYAQLPVKISILGDSYSTFEGDVSPEGNAVWYYDDYDGDKTDVTKAHQTWWNLLCEQGEYIIERNNSYSGSTICNTGYNGADATAFSFISRAGNLGNPELIVIFGGTNDYWAEVPIGEFIYEEWGKDDLFTLRPAMAYLLDSIKRDYPQTPILFVINDVIDGAVNDSIITICDRYNVDYMHLSNIDKLQGHPSIKGMTQIANQIKTALRAQ